MTCTKCSKDRPDSDFPANGDGKGGRRKQCKDCMRLINKDWRAAHRQAVSDYNKKRKKKEAEAVATA